MNNLVKTIVETKSLYASQNKRRKGRVHVILYSLKNIKFRFLNKKKLKCHLIDIVVTFNRLRPQDQIRTHVRFFST